jgi:hypothetical protein
VRTVILRSAVSGYDNPDVAIADTGSLAAIWDTVSSSGLSIDRIEVALGSFSAPPTTATIVPTGTDAFHDPRVYETSRGTAVFLWDEETANAGMDVVRALIVPAGAAIPPPVTLDTDADLVGAGVDGQGDVVVIDTTQGAFSEHVIASGGTIGKGQSFSSGSLETGWVRSRGADMGMLVDGAGDQLFFWSPSGLRAPLHAQWRSTAGVLGGAQLLGVSDNGAFGVAPAVALNAAGDAVSVLTHHGAGPMTVRFASRLGTFGTTRLLGAADRFAEMPSVSIDGRDRTLVTWIDEPRIGSSSATQVYAEAHGTSFGAPAPFAFQHALRNVYTGDAPLASANARAASTVITYAGARTSAGINYTIGQIAFPLS